MVSSQVPTDWFERYGRRIDEYRLPKNDHERQTLAEQIGHDGQYLLDRLETLSPSAVVEMLRQVWQQPFAIVDDQLRWRTHAELPPAAALNLCRLANWFNHLPRVTTRRSHFAALAP